LYFVPKKKLETTGCSETLVPIY